MYDPTATREDMDDIAKDIISNHMSQLGKKRFIGKTDAEVSKIMSEVRRKGIENKKSATESTS